MISPPHSCNPKTWAIMMESTPQKTFSLQKAILQVSVIPVFILLLSSTLFASAFFKVVRVTEGETKKIIIKPKQY